MKLKPVFAWILYSGSALCGAWVAFASQGVTGAVGAAGAAMAAAAGILGYQQSKAPF